jgi:membrane protein
LFFFDPVEKESVMAKVMENAKKLKDLLTRTFQQWNEREPFNNAIIIAYYTIFSLPGLLVIIINVAGYFFETGVIQTKISTQIGSIIGGDSKSFVEELVSTSSESKGTTIASILVVATLLFGATGVFYQTQQILNKVWGVKPHPKKKILKLIRDRFFSFGLILVVGFLMLVSLVLSAGLAAVSDWMAAHVSEGLLVVFKFFDVIVSLAIITLLFAGIYKFLPDAKIQWKDVWIGAFVTSLLFVLAKFALGLYFGNSDPASAYGAAGSIILIMLWVSYAGMILLFGAEFTQVYANRYGHKVVPSEGAISTGENEDNGAIVNKKPNQPGGADTDRSDPESSRQANSKTTKTETITTRKLGEK